VDERAIGTDLGGKYMYLVGEGNIVERRYVTVGQPGLPVTPMTEEAVAQRQAAIEGQMQTPGGEDDDSGEEE
jgi:hypothetical protein